jgi:hypothetical protein
METLEGRLIRRANRRPRHETGRLVKGRVDRAPPIVPLMMGPSSNRRTPATLTLCVVGEAVSPGIGAIGGPGRIRRT